MKCLPVIILCLLFTCLRAGSKLVEVMIEPTQFFRLQRTDMAKLKGEIENEIKTQVRLLDRQYSTYRQMRDSQVAAPPATGYPGMQSGPPSPFPFYMVQQAQRLLANSNKVANPNDAKVEKLTTQLGKLNTQIGDLKTEIKKAKVYKQKAQSKETTIVHTNNDEVEKVDSVKKTMFKELDSSPAPAPSPEHPFVNMVQIEQKESIKQKLSNGPISEDSLASKEVEETAPLREEAIPAGPGESSRAPVDGPVTE